VYHFENRRALAVSKLQIEQTERSRQMAKNQNNQVHRRAARAASKADGQPSAFDKKTPPKVNATRHPAPGLVLPKKIKGEKS